MYGSKRELSLQTQISARPCQTSVATAQTPRSSSPPVTTAQPQHPMRSGFWDSGSWRLHRCPAAGCAGCALCSQTESAEIDISIQAEGADGIHETWVRRFGRDTPIYLMAAFWAADHDVPPETVGCDLLSMPGSPLDMRKTPAELGWTGSRVELSAFPLVTELAD